MKKNWYVGIDVSKKWLDAAIFVENSDLKGFIHTQVSNNKQGYKELLRWLKEHDVDASTCTYGMEHTGFYSDGLQHFLDKKDYKYTMLEPAVIKHYPIQPREKGGTARLTSVSWRVPRPSGCRQDCRLPLPLQGHH